MGTTHTEVKQNHLRRYTDITALIYLLSQRKVTLLDPQSWDDRNDSYYLSVYREKKKFASVLALCFTEASETYHHWRVFADGASGICISFNSALLHALEEVPGVHIRPVKYLRLAQIRKKALALSELPFLKRYPFEHEQEVRAIWESETETSKKLDVRIPLSCIDGITLSPWLHKALAPQVKTMLRSIRGCGALKIMRSTLISNDEWKNLGDAASERRARRKTTHVMHAASGAS